MKKISLLFAIHLTAIFVLQAQTTWEKVFNLVQENCASCHISGHESGLVLDGSMSDVYANLVHIAAHNPVASGKFFDVVRPGDPYKSFLFSKINNDLAIDVHLSAGEGEPCPQGAGPLENKEIELIRQWILYGAKDDGDEVDEDLINTFYDEGGIQSVSSPPMAPAEGEGFQVHYGPYFLWPEDEHEYWSKFATDIPDDIEIKKLDVVMGSYSHHFIIYKYDFATYLYNEDGLRTNDPEFLGVSLVTANQFSTAIELPEKTAFKWSSDTWLDLNSHYINYSSDLPLACEVYVNVYTQPVGTAFYEMHSELPANTDIYIPNDNTFYTFEHIINDPFNNDEIFLWALTSHAHKYSDDFDIYKRNSDGTRGEKIFDASCGATNGIPGCADEIYDYQHPPIRYWDTFLPIIPKNGLIAEATYINDGPEPVWFGLTSDDEMMVEIYFYIEDTTGLNLPSVVAIPTEFASDFKIYPNPADNVFYIQLDDKVSFASNNITIEMMDMQSRIQYKSKVNRSASSVFYVNRNNLSAGLYLIKLYDDAGNVLTGKLLFE